MLPTLEVLHNAALVIDLEECKTKYTWIALTSEGEWRVNSETFTEGCATN